MSLLHMSPHPRQVPMRRHQLTLHTHLFLKKCGQCHCQITQPIVLVLEKKWHKLSCIHLCKTRGSHISVGQVPVLKHSLSYSEALIVPAMPGCRASKAILIELKYVKWTERENLCIIKIDAWGGNTGYDVDENFGIRTVLLVFSSTCLSGSTSAHVYGWGLDFLPRRNSFSMVSLLGEKR